MTRSRIHPPLKASQNTPGNIPLSSSIRELRYLSFQGGGMKGIGDVGALEVLDEYGVLPQIEAVAGSSVGGIMAMLVAIGCTAEEIKQEMLHLDFKALQDKAEPGWIESMRPSEIGSLNLLGGLEHAEDIARWAFGSSLGLFEGDRLCAVLAQILAKKGLSPNLSFGQLALLAKDRQLPQKNLILTGSNLSDRKLEYYSAETTPDMSIIEAVRISASFPGAFKPVQKLEKDGLKVRVDGGLLENLPDVFNKPPYYKPEKDGVGNPQALALSFNEKSQPSKKIKTGLGLLKSLYKTVLSDKPLKAKYGLNLIEIDTVGMGTLEFDASEAKKQKLVESGRQSAQETFKKILEQEQRLEANETLYAEMSIDHLVKLEAALKIELDHSKPSDQETIKRKLIFVKRSILKKSQIPEIALSNSTLEEMRQNARDFYTRIEESQETKMHPLSEKELEAVFLEKKEKLKNIGSMIEKRFDELQIAKQALIDYGHHLTEKIDHNKNFRQDLEELQKLQDQRSKLFLEKSPGSLEDLLKKNEHKIEQCLREKMSQYQSSDPFVAYFFQDLLQKSPDFTVPLEQEMMHKVLAPDLEECEALILECQTEMADQIKEKHLIEQRLLIFSDKNKMGDRYEALLDFNMELDAYIYKKTGFLTKLNDFFLRKAPQLAIITQPFFQCIAMASFVCSLPIAIPAISIAKVIARFSDNEQTKMTAKKIVQFFKYRNLNHNIRLKEIQKETKNFSKMIQENYEKSDRSETSYLFKLHALYLKKSGIVFEDIIQRKSHEKLENYKKRVEKVKNQFEILSYRDRVIANIGFDELQPLPILRAEVLKDIIGIEPEAFHKQNLGIDPSDLAFFYEIRNKIMEGRNLTNAEQGDFMALAPKFEKQHPSLYREFERIYASNLAVFRSTKTEFPKTRSQTLDGLHYLKPGKTGTHKQILHQSSALKLPLKQGNTAHAKPPHPSGQPSKATTRHKR